ncbi:FAS1 domain-containing protein [Candida maltosa Xu316]|uniref:FAS1 domain-containing protein n=1 Tax=Candida maltosa (strain Xu316) TaxID=1245528 RepID=M3IKE3_CANMX|nr:FAS1 domain-containing protein [Candida maltosa Xu316]
MKFSTLLSLSLATSMVASKNVVNLQGFKSELEGEQEGQPEKREPKNVVDLTHGYGSKVKREPKNVVDLTHGYGSKVKREPKNLPNLEALKAELQDGDVPKRDAKNLINLLALKGQFDNENGNKKREAKNLPNLQALKSELDAEVLGKRDAKNSLNLQALKAELDTITKRDAKNLPNLAALKAQLENISKRDAKNSFNLAALKEELETITKRDAKNTVDLAALKEELDTITKREEEQQFFTLETSGKSFTFSEVDSHNNLLQSILPQMSSISLFSSFIRQFTDIDAKTANPEGFMLIIAPSNHALETKLNDLKPWEFPKQIDEELSEQEKEDILSENLLTFLDGHLINDFEKNLAIENSDSKEDLVVISQLNNGKFVKIKQNQLNQKFAVKLIDQESWIDVEIAKRVENGYIFTIDDSFVKP